MVKISSVDIHRVLDTVLLSASYGKLSLSCRILSWYCLGVIAAVTGREIIKGFVKFQEFICYIRLDTAWSSKIYMLPHAVTEIN